MVKRWKILLSAVLCAALLLSAAGSLPDTDVSPQALSAALPTFCLSVRQEHTYSLAVVALVNCQRSAAGLPALQLDLQLCAAAQRRAAESSLQFSHYRPDGNSCFSVLEERNLSYCHAGENLASGQDSPQKAVADWLKSPEHCANMLDPSFRKTGVAVLTDSSGGYIWAQLFTD